MTRFAELDPLIVTAPTVRCGTTLLQRLICSAPNALLFGETCGSDLETFLNIFIAKRYVLEGSRGRFSARLEDVMRGNVNEWILDLAPAIDGYVDAVGEACSAPIAYWRDFARAAGRPVWGVKYPGYSPATLANIRKEMPRSRILYIYRDPADCVRSAKAQGQIMRKSDLAPFCEEWSRNLGAALQMRSENFMLLGYRALVDSPRDALRAIEVFTGAAGIDPTVLDSKINTWADEGKQEAKGTYVPPCELSGDESRIVEQKTASVWNLAGR